MNSDRVLHEPEQPVMTKVVSVGQTPLLDAPDLEIISDSSSPTDDEKSPVRTHFPTHVNLDLMPSEDEGPGDMTEDIDSGGFNSGNSFSGYDSQKFPIDMGRGDMVEAYGPR